jgi:peptidyl-prolyl cis-trans isomerase B (cyclophilin B)
MSFKLFYTLGVIALLTVSCGPIANFTYTIEKADAPAKVVFQNSSKKAETYLWQFGDGDTTSSVSPKHQYFASGNYEVTLSAINGNKEKVTKQRIVITAPQKCLVQIETTYGNMLIELFDTTPKHRDNFIKLAEEGFYDSLLFHRVIDGFMIQGGDPDSKTAKPNQPLGMGGPSYQVDAEIIPAQHAHLKGALAAARTGDNVNPARKSSGSQFYIVQGRPATESNLNMVESRMNFKYSPEQRKSYTEVGGTPQLDGAYTVFGQVIEGLDVIDKIAKVEKDARDRPLANVMMKVKVIK